MARWAAKRVRLGILRTLRARKEAVEHRSHCHYYNIHNKFRSYYSHNRNTINRVKCALEHITEDQHQIFWSATRKMTLPVLCPSEISWRCNPTFYDVDSGLKMRIELPFRYLRLFK